MTCEICHRTFEDGADRCAGCGAPRDLANRAQRGEASSCPSCESVLWSLAESCPACGARGYPALRPRFGDKALRAPETEAAGDEPDPAP